MTARMEGAEVRRVKAPSGMEERDDKSKTRVAFCLLSRRGDADEAVTLLTERAKDRDPEAMWILGVCYEYGIGVEQDIEEAVALYKHACEEGSEVGKHLYNNVEPGKGILTLSGLWLFFFAEHQQPCHFSALSLSLFYRNIL